MTINIPIIYTGKEAMEPIMFEAANDSLICIDYLMEEAMEAMNSDIELLHLYGRYVYLRLYNLKLQGKKYVRHNPLNLG